MIKVGDKSILKEAKDGVVLDAYVNLNIQHFTAAWL
jgi:hypothetical protein